MSNEQLLLSIEDLIKTLSFKRVFLISLLVAISLLLFLVFNNRNILFNKAITSTAKNEIYYEWDFSKQSKDLLTTLNFFEPVIFTGVINVDLKKNRRNVKWFFSNDSEIMDIVNIITVKTLPQPVFDYDTKNTQQMIAVLNNEFNCVRTKDSTLSQWGSAINNKIPIICRMAIPPYVGKFVGYLVIGIGRTMSKNELDSLKMEASRIAIEIYIRDVAKQAKK